MNILCVSVFKVLCVHYSLFLCNYVFINKSYWPAATWGTCAGKWCWCSPDAAWPSRPPWTCRCSRPPPSPPETRPVWSWTPLHPWWTQPATRSNQLSEKVWHHHAHQRDENWNMSVLTPSCGRFSGWRLWPRCLGVEQTPRSPSSALTLTHRFLQRATVSTVQLMSFMKVECVINHVCTLDSDVSDAAAVITHLHVETTQHSKQFEAVDAAIFDSFRHFGRSRDKLCVTLRTSHSDTLVLPVTHLSAPALSSPPVFWCLGLGQCRDLTAGRCSDNWWSKAELWCEGGSPERKTPPENSKETAVISWRSADRRKTSLIKTLFIFQHSCHKENKK